MASDDIVDFAVTRATTNGLDDRMRRFAASHLPLERILVERSFRWQPREETPMSGTPELPRPWYWEGNVQAVLATNLVAEGYQLRQVVDTAFKAAGVDIVAEKDAQGLWVTVKGYPVGTARADTVVKSHHWLSQATFDVV